MNHKAEALKQFAEGKIDHFELSVKSLPASANVYVNGDFTGVLSPAVLNRNSPAAGVSKIHVTDQQTADELEKLVVGLNK